VIIALILAGGALVFSVYLGSGRGPAGTVSRRRRRRDERGRECAAAPRQLRRHHRPLSRPACCSLARPSDAAGAHARWTPDAVVALALPANGAHWLPPVSTARSGSGMLPVATRCAPARQQRSVHALVASPDGGLLVSAGNERSLRLWEPSTAGSWFAVRPRFRRLRLAFSPDGKWLASGDAIAPSFSGTCADASGPDTRRARRSGSVAGILTRWRVAAERRKGRADQALECRRRHGDPRSQQPSRQAVTALAISPDGGGSRRPATMIRCDYGCGNRATEAVAGGIQRFRRCACLQPRWPAAARRWFERCGAVLDTQSAEAGHELLGHGGEIQAVALFPDQRTIATGERTGPSASGERRQGNARIRRRCSRCRPAHHEQRDRACLWRRL